jgi:hypothetical protein
MVLNLQVLKYPVNILTTASFDWHMSGLAGLIFDRIELVLVTTPWYFLALLFTTSPAVEWLPLRFVSFRPATASASTRVFVLNPIELIQIHHQLDFLISCVRFMKLVSTNTPGFPTSRWMNAFSWFVMSTDLKCIELFRSVLLMGPSAFEY